MDMKNIINKLFNKETILYVIFGVITTVVDFAAFGVLYYYFGLGEVLANTLAWFLAVVTAFITNKVIVFESKDFEFKVIIKEIVTFFLSRVATLVITDIFLILAKNIGMNMMLAKAVISVVVIVLNYFFSKLFIFKDTKVRECETQRNP